MNPSLPKDYGDNKNVRKGIKRGAGNQPKKMDVKKAKMDVKKAKMEKK